jgi:hypothetical protein
MVKDTLRNWKAGFRDLVFETCCGLHNLGLSQKTIFANNFS